MCVSNVFNFTNVKLHSMQLNCFCFMWLAPKMQLPKESSSLSTQGKVTLSLHVCIKCVYFDICNIAYYVCIQFSFVCESKLTVIAFKHSIYIKVRPVSKLSRKRCVDHSAGVFHCFYHFAVFAFNSTY